MQDVIAIAVSVAAGLWLVSTLWRQLLAPSCGPPPGTPAGADGFVPLDRLSGRVHPSRTPQPPADP